jgi:hypothetical protein
MPFTKVFGTTSGAWTTATLWEPILLSTPDYSWTISGSGTTEYYLRTAANGNPGFVAQPDNLYINGSNATEGTVGSLTAGQWDYGDNDTLGYSTVYVRLSDGTDPDTKDPNYVKFYQYPRATEHVRFRRTSASINSIVGMDQSGVALGDFIVEEGYQGTIGSATLGYLFIDPDRFEFSGRGECWLNITSAAISPRIFATASSQQGYRGLYLRGSAISVLDVLGGSVGLAVNPGDTATATTIRVSGAGTSCWIGNGVSLTNLHQYDGDVRLRCASTAAIIYGGKHYTEETGTQTAVTLYGGEYHYGNSSGITTFNLRGGFLNCRATNVARTIGTLNKYSGNYRIARNKEAVTVTTETIQDSYTEAISP